jgi:hypothetical protein
MRQRSETLAFDDIDDYLNTKLQAAALRGVSLPITEEYRSNLVSERFSDYWSEENELELSGYTEEFGALGEAAIQRTGATIGSTVLTSEPRDSLYSTGTALTTGIPDASLLEIDEELLENMTLLGVS